MMGFSRDFQLISIFTICKKLEQIENCRFLHLEFSIQGWRYWMLYAWEFQYYSGTWLISDPKFKISAQSFEQVRDSAYNCTSNLLFLSSYSFIWRQSQVHLFSVQEHGKWITATLHINQLSSMLQVQYSNKYCFKSRLQGDLGLHLCFITYWKPPSNPVWGWSNTSVLETRCCKTRRLLWRVTLNKVFWNKFFCRTQRNTTNL